MKPDRKKTLDREARLEALQSERNSLRRELVEVKRALGRALDVRDMLAATTRSMGTPPRWRPRSSGRKPAVTALVLFGDAHVGERTDPKQAEGWGQYCYAIAQRRTETYLRGLTQWITTLRAGYAIDDCAVVLLGDMTSGDIHEELVRTNEFPPPVQALAAGRLVAALVSGLAGRFRAVTVYGVGGSNHGRLSRKYQFKGGVLNNWDFVVYEHARALLARHTNVSLHVLPAKKEAVRIANHWFLCGHGDHVKSWMGIPWYGIERDLGRESRRRLDRLQEQLRRDAPIEGLMDYGLGAHWHTPFVGPSFRYLVNGSLSGTNEFDHSCGRHAPPQQVAALISPKHGLFGPVAWRLDTEEEARLVGTDSTGLFMGEAKHGPDAL
jgi:hypothetical protein